jgi:general secretion pathway protein G
VDAHPRLPRRFRIAPLIVALLGAIIAIVVAQTLTRPRTPPPDAAGLRARLTEMRGAIATYRTRHGHGPATLQDLVADKLLREVPLDPITRSRATWRVVTEESVSISEDFGSGGGGERHAWIVEVHSGASGADPDGRAWSNY